MAPKQIVVSFKPDNFKACNTFTEIESLIEFEQLSERVKTYFVRAIGLTVFVFVGGKPWVHE